MKKTRLPVIDSNEKYLTCKCVPYEVWIPVNAMGAFHALSQFFRIQGQGCKAIKVFLMTTVK